MNRPAINDKSPGGSRKYPLTRNGKEKYIKNFQSWLRKTKNINWGYYERQGTRAIHFSELTNQAASRFENAIKKNRAIPVRTNKTPNYYKNNRYKPRTNLGQTQANMLNRYITNLKEYFVKQKRYENMELLEKELDKQRYKKAQAAQFNKESLSVQGPTLIYVRKTGLVDKPERFLERKGSKIREKSNPGFTINTYSGKQKSETVETPSRVDMIAKNIFNIVFYRTGAITFQAPSESIIEEDASTILELVMGIKKGDIGYARSKYSYLYEMCLSHRFDIDNLDDCINDIRPNYHSLRDKITKTYGKGGLTYLSKRYLALHYDDGFEVTDKRLRVMEFMDKVTGITYKVFSNGKVTATVKTKELKDKIYSNLKHLIDYLEKAGVRIIRKERSDCQVTQGLTTAGRKAVQNQARLNKQKFGKLNAFDPNENKLANNKYAHPLAGSEGLVQRNVSEAKYPSRIIQRYLQFYPNINIENENVRKKYGLNRIKGITLESIKQAKKGKAPMTNLNKSASPPKAAPPPKSAKVKKVKGNYPNYASPNWVKIEKGEKMILRPTGKTVKNQVQFGWYKFLFKTPDPKQKAIVREKITKYFTNAQLKVPKVIKQLYGIQQKSPTPSPVAAPAPAPVAPAPSRSKSRSRSRSRSSSANWMNMPTNIPGHPAKKKSPTPSSSSNSRFARELEQHMRKVAEATHIVESGGAGPGANQARKLLNNQRRREMAILREQTRAAQSLYNRMRENAIKAKRKETAKRELAQVKGPTPNVSVNSKVNQYGTMMKRKRSATPNSSAKKKKSPSASFSA